MVSIVVYVCRYCPASSHGGGYVLLLSILSVHVCRCRLASSHGGGDGAEVAGRTAAGDGGVL